MTWRLAGQVRERGNEFGRAGSDMDAAGIGKHHPVPLGDQGQLVGEQCEAPAQEAEHERGLTAPTASRHDDRLASMHGGGGMNRQYSGRSELADDDLGYPLQGAEQ